MPSSPRALFRHRLVSEVEGRVLAGASKNEAVRAVAGRQHLDHRGRLVIVSQTTLHRWVAAYRQHGARGLENKGRHKAVDSVVLPPELLGYLRSVKADDPAASIPEILRSARLEGVIPPDLPVDRVTVWRACGRMQLPLTRSRQLAQRDMRPFAYPHRMLMVLADGKHFRAGVRRLKRVALTFLDDCTRFGLGGFVGTVEETRFFLEGLSTVTHRYGLMNICYLDHGPGFVSDDTHAVFARLDRLFIHGAPAYPEGHGKIERFHRTLQARLLRSWAGNPAIDPDTAALTLRYSHWLEHIYNHTPHEALDGQTPAQRWHDDSRALVYREPDWLRSRFILSLTRRVTAHNVIPYNSIDYEVPLGHAHERITVYRHLLEQGPDGQERLSVFHQGARVFLAPVDLAENAYSRRGKGLTSQPTPAADQPPPRTAADRAHERAFDPLVDDDGGFTNPSDEEGEDR